MAAFANLQQLKSKYICECCPEKPKKFDTQEDLSAHQMEKQYTCQCCHLRFKNKNEAERHQNMLHLRRYTWSCATISGPEAAYTYDANPCHIDQCAFCGISMMGDWSLKFKHLIDIHKFQKCNQAKKFYRADHFRQHVKHSHAGTIGMWTKTLEDACMGEKHPPDTPIMEDRTVTEGPEDAVPKTGKLPPQSIPQCRPDKAPPPLPPPGFIEGLAGENDQGWRWSTTGGVLAPIHQSSSLLGGYRRPLDGDGNKRQL